MKFIVLIAALVAVATAGPMSTPDVTQDLAALPPLPVQTDEEIAQLEQKTNFDQEEEEVTPTTDKIVVLSDSDVEKELSQEGNGDIVFEPTETSEVAVTKKPWLIKTWFGKLKQKITNAIDYIE